MPSETCRAMKEGSSSRRPKDTDAKHSLWRMPIFLPAPPSLRLSRAELRKGSCQKERGSPL